MAVCGAILGATIRPRLMGLPLAVALAGGMRALIGVLAAPAVDHPDAPIWNQLSLAASLDPVGDYIPVLGACGGAALIAALLGMLLEPKTQAPATVSELTATRRRVDNGRYVRAAGMVEERPVQARAEERQRALLGL
jgi:hypothetical protein